MPLELALMEEEDAPAFATIDGLAMADWPIGRAMVLAMSGTGETRHDVIERWYRQGFRNDSELVWLKVTDTGLGGEIIACALWRYHLDGAGPKIEAPRTTQEGASATKTPETEPEPKVTIWTALDRAWGEFREEFIGSKPHANLQICIAHPKHQRRGAGSMLVQWGCDKADKRGLMSVLQSSAAGLRLYQKHGFTIVKQSTMDLRPYGVDETELRRSMMRPAKG
ncbi:hypothetical protein LTR53_005638 [Teratosphaeriaceae sp. CCFEE 6253]|nr:hypothetical protein LTR53_005638 [Teratosphaeriaceae sp. CCFEE 6253]